MAGLEAGGPRRDAVFVGKTFTTQCVSYIEPSGRKEREDPISVQQFT